MNGRSIFKGECFACALHESLRSSKEETETVSGEDKALNELLRQKFGKKRWLINLSGYCMVEAWDFALKIATGSQLNGNYSSLLQKALCELRSNPDIYHLVGNYKDELLRYETLGDYTAGAVDSLPFALVNVTQVKCTIIQVNKDGKDCSITLYPFNHEVGTDFHGPEIKLIFSRFRRHYDVAVDPDFHPNKASGMFTDTGIGIPLHTLKLILLFSDIILGI